VRFSAVALLVAVGAMTAWLSDAARAERRVALVIGNGAYKNVPALPNPAHDAKDVGDALKRIGFETITAIDVDKNGMDAAAIRFTRAARDADVAMFYYSGHALQYNGINYLIPVDAKLPTKPICVAWRGLMISLPTCSKRRICGFWCWIPAATIRSLRI